MLAPITVKVPVLPMHGSEPDVLAVKVGFWFTVCVYVFEFEQPLTVLVADIEYTVVTIGVTLMVEVWIFEGNHV